MIEHLRVILRAVKFLQTFLKTYLLNLPEYELVADGQEAANQDASYTFNIEFLFDLFHSYVCLKSELLFPLSFSPDLVLMQAISPSLKSSTLTYELFPLIMMLDPQ